MSGLVKLVEVRVLPRQSRNGDIKMPKSPNLRKDPTMLCMTEGCVHKASWSILKTPWSKENKYICQKCYEAGKFYSSYRLDVQTPRIKRPEEIEIL